MQRNKNIIINTRFAINKVFHRLLKTQAQLFLTKLYDVIILLFKLVYNLKCYVFAINQENFGFNHYTGLPLFESKNLPWVTLNFPEFPGVFLKSLNFFFILENYNVNSKNIKELAARLKNF